MSGGAWKVAYADFVTAMMALFMVLWISAQDEDIIFKTVQYFKDPFGIGFSDEMNRGGIAGKGGDGSGNNISINEHNVSKTSMVDMSFLHKLASEYYKRLNIVDTQSKKKPVKVTVADDGLRITIFDNADKPLFVKNTAKFTEWGDWVMKNLAWLIDRYPMKIRIDAHVPTGVNYPNPNYGPWELTAERANAARRVLGAYTLSAQKIHQISGFADTQPIAGISPDDSANRRLEVSLIMK